MSGKKTKSPKNRKSSTGKEYERIVASIHRQFADSAEVTENEKIKGRQIDVAIRKSVIGNEILIIAECKDHGRVIAIERVDEIIGKMQDVDAARGVLVSDSGFTKGARGRAERDGRVDLISVIDTNNSKLRSRVTVPVQVALHEVAGTEHFQLSWETGGLLLPRPDNITQAINDAIMRFVAWFNENPDLPAGEHVHSQEFECSGHLFNLKSKITIKISNYLKENLFMTGVGVFDHTKSAPTPESKLSIHIDVENDPTWEKVPNDYALKNCRNFYTRVATLNEATANFYTIILLSKFPE